MCIRDRSPLLPKPTQEPLASLRGSRCVRVCARVCMCARDGASGQAAGAQRGGGEAPLGNEALRHEPQTARRSVPGAPSLT
eukprot:3691231-Rhodomonas_salina.2